MALKFSTVYLALLVACGGVALVVPGAALDRVRGPLSVLFVPVSVPSKAVADGISRRWSPEGKVADASVPEDAGALQRENTALRAMVVSLQSQLQDLKRLNTDREALGPVRDRTVSARVIGSDAGTGGLRRFLSVTVRGGNNAGSAGGTGEGAGAMSGGGVSEGMVAVSPQGLVGKVASSGLGGARVMLTTDPEFKMRGSFVRFTARGDGGLEFHWLASPTPLVVGTGAGMRITNLSMKELASAGVAPGDWLVVNDADFPPLLQGFRIGYVTSIRETIPLWAEITVSPASDLMRLKELMIVNRP